MQLRPSNCQQIAVQGNRNFMYVVFYVEAPCLVVGVQCIVLDALSLLLHFEGKEEECDVQNYRATKPR